LYSALIYGCGGSGGSGESNESAYYDQLWAIAKESITPDMADAEISEALARWIVDHSTNARWVPPNSTYPLPDGARGSEDDILPFHGLCDDRSVLFVNLATRAGLTASVFFIFDFGAPGNDHTCVQVFYEDDWHFFDVTYAGMFKVDGDVLSYLWEVVEGVAYLQYPTRLNTSVDLQGAQAGLGSSQITTYRLRLTATDCPGADSSAELTIRYTCTGTN